MRILTVACACMMLLGGMAFAGTPTPDEVLNKAAVRPRGKFVEVTAPDTLDLAERARLAINCIVNIIQPQNDYFSPCNVQFTGKVLLHPLTWNLPCEYVFSLPLARTMCGSEQGLDVELGTMRSFLNGMGSDGIIYSPREDLGKPKGSCFPDNIGFVAFAIANWYERDGNKRWLDYLQALCDGFDKMAIKREDRAFYPPEFCYLPGGQWVPEGRGKVPTFTGEEPGSDQQGYEGAVKYYHAAPMQALVKNYEYSGDAASLELAQRLKRFMLKPAFWQDTSAERYDGVEHGVFGGHYHGNLIPLWALLNLAVATHDEPLLQQVRAGYEHARRFVAPELGWSPCYIYPAKFEPGHKHAFCDSCNIADTIALAVKLSETGAGDFWDDAEYCLRNQFAESQMMDNAPLRPHVESDPQGQKYLDDFLGGFFQTEPTSLYMRESPFMPGCCIGSGPWGLYFGWQGITQFSEGVATINMFLNRSAAWLDVESWVPYEGKVVIRNKQAHTLMVRIPGWLKGEKIDAEVNGQAIHPAEVENRLVFSNLRPGQTITLHFPLRERTRQIHIEGQAYQLTRRGPTVVDIQPRLEEAGIVPIYERAALRQSTAPMKKVRRFIPEKMLPLP